MAIRVGIMGFGRIGRNIFRQVWERDDIDVVAISDLGTPESMAYLLKFDTIYGRFAGDARLDGRYLTAGRQRARLVRAVSPEDMPWDALGVDVVVEATGQYAGADDLQAHLDSGAQRVVLTAPAEDGVDLTVVHGINEALLAPDHRLVSCASTSTHALCLSLHVLDRAFGIDNAFMTVVHAYSGNQRLADTVAGDLRYSRSAAENLIPNGTFLPELIGELMPHLAGRIDGMALNVPVPNGSNLDLVTQLRDQEVTADAVNAAARAAADGELKGWFGYTDEPIVSSDVIGNPHSVVFDSLATMALPGGLVKTIGWFDNGWGFASRVAETVTTLGAFGDPTDAADAASMQGGQA